MKIRTFTLLGLILAAAACVRAKSYTYREAFSRSGAFASNGRIALHNINGEIAVRTWDKNEILIEGEKSAPTEAELKLIQLTIELSPTQADIRVRLPRRPHAWFSWFFGGTVRGAVRFKLTVPKTVSLDAIDTVNSSVDVDGVEGTVMVQNVNGNIRTRRLGGSADLETVNGGIQASFDKVTPQQSLSFHTINGSIEVALPADTGAKIHASVVNGRIATDFPVAVQGHIVGKDLEGKIGDGSASLEATSINGRIHLRKHL